MVFKKQKKDQDCTELTDTLLSKNFFIRSCLSFSKRRIQKRFHIVIPNNRVHQKGSGRYGSQLKKIATRNRSISYNKPADEINFGSVFFFRFNSDEIAFITKNSLLYRTKIVQTNIKYLKDTKTFVPGYYVLILANKKILWVGENEVLNCQEAAIIVRGDESSTQKQLSDTHRIAIWNPVQKYRLVGNYAPMRKYLTRFLTIFPKCEIYLGQDLDFRIHEFDLQPIPPKSDITIVNTSSIFEKNCFFCKKSLTNSNMSKFKVQGNTSKINRFWRCSDCKSFEFFSKEEVKSFEESLSPNTKCPEKKSPSPPPVNSSQIFVDPNRLNSCMGIKHTSETNKNNQFCILQSFSESDTSSSRKKMIVHGNYLVHEAVKCTISKTENENQLCRLSAHS